MGVFDRPSSILFLAILVFSLAMNPLTLSAEVEKQVTFAPHGHVLTNIDVWSPDSRWITYDVRSDPAGSVFDGQRIERVNIESGKVEVLFRAQHEAHCGVVTVSPKDGRIVFIHGPENPTDDWQYAACHRRGVLIDLAARGEPVNLDARDLVSPYTPGALRGGTHVHTFSGDGKWVAFTYEDHVLESLATRVSQPDDGPGPLDTNQRNVGVSVPVRTVATPKGHPRNHSGSHFSVLVTRTDANPRPGSDDISRAFSDAWIGTNGYVRSNGVRQHKAIAFQGLVSTENGRTISEVFVVDLPEDVTRESEWGPLQGTSRQRPQPPRGTRQRRLTYSQDRDFPGIQGVRHWLRSAPDGSKIAFLMKSNTGVAQIYLISPNGGEPQQLTQNSQPIGSAFSWSPDGTMIAHAMDESICVTLTKTGETIRLTDPDSRSIRPEACVFSPDGSKIAYVRHITVDERSWNQIFVLDWKTAMASR